MKRKDRNELKKKKLLVGETRKSRKKGRRKKIVKAFLLQKNKGMVEPFVS